MSLKRLIRHLLMTHWRVRRAFSQSTLQAIEAAIAKAEQSHGGEIRFAVEGELDPQALWNDVTPRARALQLFGGLGVWDTADNNGVLIYLLLADRDVEIVADRGFSGKITSEEWAAVCRSMEQAFGSGEFRRGALDGIAATSALIARHYPSRDRDELANAPVVM